MNRKYGIATTVLLCVAMVAAATPLWAEDKIDLHVSDNGRFLVHTDGSGFFPVADTAWAIAWRLTRGGGSLYGPSQGAAIQHRCAGCLSLL